MTQPAYTAEPISDTNGLTDVRIHIDGKTWHLWGRNGLEREAALADAVQDGTLPVLMGSGLGHCLKNLVDRGVPVAVVDREEAIIQLTGATSDNVLWINDDDPQRVLEHLAKWQSANDCKPFSPVVIPLYQRLARDYYGALTQTLKSTPQADFWSQARYPKFQSTPPRVLFINSDYFLCNEILAALKRLKVEHQVISLEDSATGSSTFIEDILKAAIDFKPDFILTVNHFGLDREGKFAELLDNLGLPLASWFVDNPHLILYDYAHPGTDNTVIFTFDAGNLDEMRNKGFSNVHYLPLATDPHRFQPGLAGNPTAEWASDISFVGNSMTAPVADSLAKAELPEAFRDKYEALAETFGKSGETSIPEFLATNAPDWLAVLKALPTRENKLALESLLTWEATRQYRLSCVQAILKYSPLIVGDTGWGDLLGKTTGWRHLSRLDYYQELPRFYPMSKINFNCTSRQMVGAVNQRVFDVPACGGFIITDHRDQMEDLFDLGKEAIVYKKTEEISPLMREFLADKNLRESISAAARKRILAEHTYEIRLQKLLQTMRESFL